MLIDIPSKVYGYDIAEWLQEMNALCTLRVLIITRLNPERIDPLKKLLSAVPGPLRILASNPALQLLKERAGADEELKSLLENGNFHLEAVSRSTDVQLSSGHPLRFIPVPTPRWPDLCAVYFPEDEVLFSSSFFAAHEAAAEGAGAFDQGGW